MDDLVRERAAFRARKRAAAEEAQQLLSVQLLLGSDLARALAGGPGDRAELARRLRRCLERERLRGLRRHWSYDLNRHIALKQALDRLAPEKGRTGGRGTAGPRGRLRRARAPAAGRGG